VPKCFRYAISVPGRADRPQYPHHMRDGDAAIYWVVMYVMRGFQYGGVIFNYPSKGPERISVDTSFLTPRDVILMTTRPPLDDHLISGGRIARSYTTLEDRIFHVLRKWFDRLSRAEIVISDHAAGLNPEIARYQTLEFWVNGGSSLRAHGSPHTRDFQNVAKSARKAIGFYIYEPEIWSGGPALSAVFSLGGVDTLAWTYLFTTRYPKLIDENSFVMAELTRGAPIDRPENIHFADTWDVRILGNAPIVRAA